MEPMHIYRGRRLPTSEEEDQPRVTIDDQPQLLCRFEWGYNGSGPAQLALTILAHEFGSKVAYAHHQEFKRQVVALWPHDGWETTSTELAEWLARQPRDSA